MRRRLLAWIMTFMIAFGTMPTNLWQASALEAPAEGTGSNAAQIGKHYDVSQEDGSFDKEQNPDLDRFVQDGEENTVSNTFEQDQDNWRVWIDKTIAPTGVENLFDITLDVKTKNRVVTPQVETSVVLVIDLSSSMANEANRLSDGQKRIDAAKTATIEFIKEYSAIPNGKRNLSIVGFNTDSWVELQWTDVSKLTEAQKNELYEKIRNLDTARGTNLDGGLLSARDLLNTCPTASQKMVVLLSDGEPTCYVPDRNTGNGQYSHVRTYGDKDWVSDSDRHNSHSAAATSVATIMGTGENQLGVDIRTIYCGRETDNVGGKGKCTEYCDLSTLAYLKKITAEDKVTLVNSKNTLINAFSDINNKITLLTKAWQTTDPMGVNSEWREMISADGDWVSATSGKLDWDLTKTPPSEIKNNEGEVIGYHYSVTYRVKLDTLADGYEFDKWYATNGVTELKYYHEENNQGYIDPIYFNVPSVQGYKGGYYELIKVDEQGNGLGGATFTLTHACDEEDDCTKAWAKTYISDTKGWVRIPDIPSGHKYILQETATPNGYVSTNETHVLEVRYGKVYVDGVSDKKLTIKNVKLGDYTGTKIWNDENNKYKTRPNNLDIAIYKKGSNEALDSQPKWKKNGNEWVYTFENLPMFNDDGTLIQYEVRETTVPDGYTDKQTVTDAKYTVWDSDATGINTAVSGPFNNGMSFDIAKSGPGFIIAQTNLADDTTGYWIWTSEALNEGKKAIINNIAKKAYADFNEDSCIYVSGASANYKYTDTSIYRNNVREARVTYDNSTRKAELGNIKNQPFVTWYYGTVLGKFEPGTTELTNDIVKDVERADNKILVSKVDQNDKALEGAEFTLYETYDVETKQFGNAVKIYDEQTFEISTADKCFKDKLPAAGESKTFYLVETKIPAGCSGEAAPKEVVITASEDTAYNENAKKVLTTTTYDITIDDGKKDASIVNSYETVNVSGTKVWDDHANEAGKRPEKITVNLIGSYVKDEVTYYVKDDFTVTTQNAIFASETVSGDNTADTWDCSFEELPKYVDGNEISWEVTENEVPEYSTKITGTAEEGYQITNTYPAKVDIPVTKTWVDGDDRDGKRPESITVTLFADGDEVETKTITKADKWSWDFTELPKYREDGSAIEYTVTEAAVEDYETVINGYNITNTHEIETVDVAGTKTWDDADDQDGIRPNSITVRLFADGKEVYAKTVTAEEDWAWSFTDLPKYRDGGTEIVYTVTEEAVAGYTPTIDGFNITNTHTPEKTTVVGTKTWNDANNQDGIRPNSITVKLLADGEEVEGKTLTVTGEGNEWSYEFTDLPKYKNGKQIDYTVTEEPVKGYTTATNGFNFTNSHTPETVAVEGSKTWEDGDNQDGIRPDSIEVNLLADGAVVDTKTVTEEDDWAWNFTNLPKYAAGKVKQEIAYSITETPVEGYETVVNGYDITNTHKIETVDIEGSKTWNDRNNEDGKRPESITISLLANNEVIDTKIVTAADGWAWVFEDLDKYANGVEINYTIAEEVVEGYSTTYDGYNVINEYEPTDNITVKKSWNDNNNQDGIRTDAIEVVLYADGVATDKSAVLNAENGWTATFENLARYSGDERIDYTVEEVKVDGYTPSIEKIGTVFTITNTHKTAEVKVPVTKTWDDDNDRDGLRPDSITIKLYADGEATDKTVKLTADNNWTGAFENLPKYKDGAEIVYTVEEVAVDGYETVVDGYNITNTHEVKKTSVNVAKVWIDGDDQDDIRPESIEVELYADKEATGQTLTLDASNNWSGKFENLNKNNNGKAIKYTVKEVNVPEGYEATVTGNQETGYTITNTHAPAEVAVSGKKVWDDVSNQDGIRPTEITVKLLADGKEYAKQTVTGDSNTWEYVFNNLPKYNKGVEIKYTVDEVAVDGYTTSITGTTITNTHQVEKTSVSGTKTWNDANNQDGKRPEAIQINLLANGQKVAEKTVTEADGWAWSFTELDKFAAGEEIKYTYSEVVVENYSVKYEGTNVINGYAPEKTSVTVSKTWNDDNNRDGIRPDDVTVVLYADGEATDKTLKLNAENNWIASFEELDKYKAEGVEIAYTVKEVAVSGYEAIITGDVSTGYNIENVHEIDTTSVSGSKTWIDADNQDGKRPEAITVNLLADGEEIDQAVVGEAEGWAWTFDNLPKYEDGKAIEYTVTEDKVEGYVTEVNGYDITNTYEIETTEITITKGWMEDNKKDRPESIQVNILANGELYRTVELTEAGGWELTVTDLPMYTEGEVGVIAVYSIEEVPVEGYEAEIEGFDIFNTKVDPSDDSEQDKDKDKDKDKDGKDKDGDKDSAKTGDNMNLMALATAALAALAAAFAAIFRRKKNA